MSMPQVKLPDLQELVTQIGVWADNTFPLSRLNPLPSLHHLQMEVSELIAAPYDLIEYADAATLLFDAARKAGYNVADVVEAMQRKLAINKTRTWGKPDENGVVEHVES